MPAPPYGLVRQHLPANPNSMFQWIGQYIGLTASAARALVVDGMREHFDFWSNAWCGRTPKGRPECHGGFFEYLYYMEMQDTCGTGLELIWFSKMRRMTILIFAPWCPENQHYPHGYYYDCGACASAKVPVTRYTYDSPPRHVHPVTIATGW